MKRMFILMMAVLILGSCNQASELPPINDGFATEFIMPDPVNLTEDDRAYIEQLEKEYENAINNINN